MAIGHMEKNTVVVDLVRGQRGTPSVIVEEYTAILKTYKILEVHGDRYGGSWPRDEFQKWRIEYKTSEQAKSGLYQDTLPMLNSGRVELPPDDRLMLQFMGLERRTSRSGRDSIDHAPNGHDDRANAVAGLIAHTLHRVEIPTNLKCSFIR
jgi:hypothetical protein